ncbi:MAG TPA: hypothetical protein VMM59_04755 [Thermohalobaculum sp.]|nr:hypothetical protein [Thermohalobaculum sp.]
MARAQLATDVSVGIPASVETARRHLVAARAALEAEIRAYPTPIAGCDAQFNHLLAERRRVLAALRALDAPVHIPTPRAP